MYQLYYLIDPRNYYIKYVGITKDAHLRFKCHCNDLRSNTKKTAWIKKLKSLNLKPILKIVQTNLSKQDAEILEIKEISSYKLLLNSARGGLVNSGFKLSNKTKAIMSAQRLGDKNGFYNKTHTKEIRSVISKSNSKPIKDSNGNIYSSMSEAALMLNIAVQNISAVIRNKRKTAGGLSFVRL